MVAMVTYESFKEMTNCFGAFSHKVDNFSFTFHITLLVLQQGGEAKKFFKEARVEKKN
jgi:hypothetical protein